MTTKNLTKKIQDMEKRIQSLEELLDQSTKKPKSSKRGLELLYGLWADKPRTEADLREVRRRLWGST